MASLSNTISVTAGGIDVPSIVHGLMAAERAPLAAMLSRQNAVQQQVDGIKGIKSGIEAMGAQLSSMLASGIGRYSSSVSNPASAGVVLGPSARAGSVAFTVDRLASSHGLRTATSVPSSTTTVTTASRLALSSSARPLGITGVAADQTVASGAYDVTVTKATAGAAITGGAAVGPVTVIDGSHSTLDVTIDGVARELTLAPGSYTPSGLRGALQAAIDSSGGGVTATLDGTNHLKLTTHHEGSAATLGITGGSALTQLGFTVTTPAVVGVDGTIKVGTNPAVTVTSAGLAELISVDAGSGGNLSLTLGSGLRLGTAKVAVVPTGDRSLAAVATAINSSNAGVTASAVKAGDGAWVLQLNSTKSGSASAIALDPATFSNVGGLLQTSAAQDAQVTIGTGPGAYSVTAAGNTFADILPGTTINATALSATPVTVTVGRDDAAIAASVDELITKANDVIKLAVAQTKYDPATRTVAPLAADSTVRSLAASLRSQVTSIVGGTPPLLAADFGITAQRDGTLTFDKAVFTAKLANDPDAVERLFKRGGTGAGGVRFAAATEGTAGGAYSVEVTTAATRATTHDVLVGGSAAARRIGVRVGTTSVTHDVAAGASAADIATGLNTALAHAGLNVTAELSGGGVRLTATRFGFAGNFESNLDVDGAGSWTANAGTDVQGKINGEAAIGSGQRLSLLNLGTSPARGLAVDVDEGVTGALPSFEYQPGIAARLQNLAANLTGTLGSLTTSTGAYEAKVRGFNDQVAKFEDRLTRLEANYRRQWTAVQTALSSLQNQQDWLTRQIGGMAPSST